ncbi:MAG: hypothetical protein KAX19_09790 [Candidatus Brocadiae bacterium]|nr:hypothetical protein [Candidatus Brocadiia bacterium]
METLEEQFHKAMIAVYERARDECGYNATRFLQMVMDLGGLEAAKRLLDSDKVSSGLTKLWELGRLDISMEALVIDPKWQGLFTEEEVATARQRLEDCRYFESK